MKEKVNNLVLFDKVRLASQWSWGYMCLLRVPLGMWQAMCCKLEQQAATAINT